MNQIPACRPPAYGQAGDPGPRAGQAGKCQSPNGKSQGLNPCQRLVCEIIFSIFLMFDLTGMCSIPPERDQRSQVGKTRPRGHTMNEISSPDSPAWACGELHIAWEVCFWTGSSRKNWS
jgi:hypothetical protein